MGLHYDNNLRREWIGELFTNLQSSVDLDELTVSGDCCTMEDVKYSFLQISHLPRLKKFHLEIDPGCKMYSSLTDDCCHRRDLQRDLDLSLDAWMFQDVDVRIINQHKEVDFCQQFTSW